MKADFRKIKNLGKVREGIQEGLNDLQGKIRFSGGEFLRRD